MEYHKQTVAVASATDNIIIIFGTDSLYLEPHQARFLIKQLNEELKELELSQNKTRTTS